MGAHPDRVSPDVGSWCSISGFVYPDALGRNRAAQEARCALERLAAHIDPTGCDPRGHDWLHSGTRVADSLEKPGQSPVRNRHGLLASIREPGRSQPRRGP